MIWDEDYLFGETPDDEETALETAFLIDALELTRRDRLLDVACGAGRHAVRLAERCELVVGADASDPLLRAGARRPRRNLAYVRADMRALPFSEAFDAAVCLFASFGLCGDAGDRQALRSMSDALAPNGVLLIESWNPFAVAELDGRRNWWRAGDRLHLAEARFDLQTGTVRDRREIVGPDGAVLKAWTRETRFYSAPELTRLAAEANLIPLRWFGDFDGSDYAYDSPRLIAAFEKAAR